MVSNLLVEIPKVGLLGGVPHGGAWSGRSVTFGRETPVMWGGASGGVGSGDLRTGLQMLFLPQNMDRALDREPHLRDYVHHLTVSKGNNADVKCFDNSSPKEIHRSRVNPIA